MTVMRRDLGTEGNGIELAKATRPMKQMSLVEGGLMLKGGHS